VSAADAVAGIRPGQTIVVGGSNAEPRILVEALLARSDLRDLTVLMWPGGFPTPLCDPALTGRVRTLLPVPNAHTRAAIEAGQAEYVPGTVHRTLRRLGDGRPPLDAALVMVSPPDAEGWCSLGTSVVNLGPACRAAARIVAEINDQMPRTHGESRIHITDIDASVETSYPLPELAPATFGPREEAIAGHVAGLVRDGSTIECGIGALPNAVLAALHGHRDLRIHSGIVGDSLVDLAASGALAEDRAEAEAPVVCAGSVLGTRRLYEWVDDNPLVQMRTGLYTHDPMRMVQHKQFVAINSAIEIDLSGQVNAEMVGGATIAGVGGQSDFSCGARLSPGGSNILVLGATARRGTTSRIVRRLAAGTPVAMPRADVEWVVTEHGAVNLEGLTVSERAAALISIADPAHRAALRDSAGAGQEVTGA
jgi:4-hydroxybutyrate CoA-transferase